MDPAWQLIFNGVIGVAMALGVGILSAIWAAITKLQAADLQLAQQINTMQRYMEENFVRSVNLRDALHPIREQLVRIETKLDRKVDREDCAVLVDRQVHK